MSDDSIVVNVTFQDLSDAASDLSSGDTSPRIVRQRFAKFINVSQQLTSHIRKEYKEKTGQSWDAGGFDSWNDVTELFKELRNEDQHVRPVSIVLHERLRIRVWDDTPDIVVEGTWEYSLEDQLAEESRDDVHIIDPTTAEGILPTQREIECHLVPPSPKAKSLLDRINDPNVQTLTEKCFNVLTDYYRYYQRQLAES